MLISDNYFKLSMVRLPRLFYYIILHTLYIICLLQYVDVFLRGYCTPDHFFDVFLRQKLGIEFPPLEEFQLRSLNVSDG